MTLAFWIIEKRKTGKMDTKSNKKPRKDPVANKKRLVSKTIIYDESKPNQWLDDPPLEIWDHVIIPMLGLKDLALARPVCTFFEAYWQDKFSNNVLPLIVGNDVATIDRAMRVIEILSSRRQYTKANPFLVLLGKGDHQITSSWARPEEEDDEGYVQDDLETMLALMCSNIIFLGTGIDTTRILGGFAVCNIENITFKNMTVTHIEENGYGIYTRNAKVKLTNVALEECNGSALCISSVSSATAVVATRCKFATNQTGVMISGILASATFNNCVFHDNCMDGITAYNKATIHLHGEATAIHNNGGHAIRAVNSAKVVIHLPSHHNTFYNNRDEDRHTNMGGTITNVED